MKLSLIMATVGRDKEVIDFILSLNASKDIKLSDVELIVIDQNSKDFELKNKIESHDIKFNLVYIHSDIKGLSYCRNVGIKYAKGEIIAFPDDDCLYYENTLICALNIFNMRPELSITIGRIYDRKNNINLFKKWPTVNCDVNKFNFYQLSSSITIFVKKELGLYFDENMGAGRIYGSCEDPDYIYRILQYKYKAAYYPSIEVWHPAPELDNIDLNKVKSYASGFGYFVCKDISIVKISLLFLLIIKKAYQFIFQYRKIKRGYFMAFFKGLFKGLLNDRLH